MTEILFGQSYYLRFDPKLWKAKQPYPPLGTLYAASYLRKNGYNVGLFDAMLSESEKAWEEALDRYQPSFAIIYEDNFNYLTKMCLHRMRQAAFTMIEMAQVRGCTVILSGSDTSDYPESYLKKGADFALIGEGEITLLSLMNALTGREENTLDSIHGLAFMKDGEVFRTPPRGEIKDLDALPFPAWDLVDTPRYKNIWHEHHGFYSMNMVTTRGCPYHCNWCAKPIWGQRYNARSPENVVAEMKWLRDTYQPDHIWFADDIMGLIPGWLPRFAELVEVEKSKIPFKCLNRADLLLREGEIEALKRAGCQIAWIGAESGAQKILDAMDKGTNVEQIYEVSRRLHQMEIQVGFFLQFGYPGEDRLDISKTIQMVRDCQPDDIGISISYPLPGTKLYESVESQLGNQQHWIDSSDLAMMYNGPFSTHFYRQLYITIHKEFRARQTWQLLKKPYRVGIIRITKMIYQWLTLPIEQWKLERLTKSPQKA